MHGRQNTSRTTTSRAFGPIGAVTRSLVGPKIAVSGTPSAAATCIAPESFETNAAERASTPINSVSVVRPTRSITRTPDGRLDSIARAVSRSDVAPTSTGASAPFAQRGHELGDAIGWPALRVTVRGSRREADDPPIRWQAGAGEQPIGALKRRLPRNQPRHIVGRLDAETAHEIEVIAHVVHVFARAWHRTGQQPSPAAGAISPALSNSTAVGEPCAAEGIRKQKDRRGGESLKLRLLGLSIDDDDLVQRPQRPRRTTLQRTRERQRRSCASCAV